jgi:hypothetical protein
MTTYDISGYKPLKPGTKIIFDAGGVDEEATIGRWSKISGPRNGLPAGYETVRFNTGGVLLVHCGRFRVAS